MVSRDLLDCREVLLRRVEVIYSHLVHRDVHYWTVRPLPVVGREVRLASDRNRAATAAGAAHDSSRVLFLDLLCWLEDRREEALVLHETTIMVVLADSSDDAA